MSTKTTFPQRGFRVKVVGEFYARSEVMGEKRVVKTYEFEANIPTLDSALSTVKNKLLTAMLRKKHPDYIMYRTYHITQITPLDEKAKHQMRKVEVQYMDRSSLVDYIVENHLPVDSRLYPDLFKLRVAVQEAKIDPDAYLKKLELRRSDLEMELQLAELNPGLHDQKETPASVSVANRSAKESKVEGGSTVKKNLSPAAIAKQAEKRVDGLRKDMIDSGEHGEADDEPSPQSTATPSDDLGDI